jgi:hypothetical protein
VITVTGAFLPSPAVVQASTSLVLDAAAATCLTARKTLRLPDVLSAAVRDALLIDMMTIVIVLGANLTSHLTMQHLNPVVSSRMKTFPAIFTSSYLLFLQEQIKGIIIILVLFRWVLTRGTLASALVSKADIAIDDAKENAWMTLYDHDSDTLEDILYRRLQDLWAPLTDTMKVFDTHGSAQQLCAQKVWEALLTAFPLDHKRMQTVLLAREIAHMMCWDGDPKGAVNRHFACHQTPPHNGLHW